VFKCQVFGSEKETQSLVYPSVDEKDIDIIIYDIHIFLPIFRSDERHMSQSFITKSNSLLKIVAQPLALQMIFKTGDEYGVSKRQKVQWVKEGILKERNSRSDLTYLAISDKSVMLRSNVALIQRNKISINSSLT